MRQLLYISNTDDKLPQAELDRILGASRRNNVSLGLTGMLLYLGGAFLQVLEGPEESVEKIYTRIRSDSRHWEARTLLESDILHRAFGAWSMGFHELKPGQADADGLFRISREAIAGRWTADAATELKTMMQTFYRVQIGNRAKTDFAV
jgi:hypothetical protein